MPGSTDEDLEASEFFQRYFWEHPVIDEDSYSPAGLNQVEQAAVCSVEEQPSPVEDSFTNPLENSELSIVTDRSSDYRSPALIPYSSFSRRRLGRGLRFNSSFEYRAFIYEVTAADPFAESSVESLSDQGFDNHGRFYSRFPAGLSEGLRVSRDSSSVNYNPHTLRLGSPGPSVHSFELASSDDATEYIRLQDFSVPRRRARSLIAGAIRKRRNTSSGIGSAIRNLFHKRNSRRTRETNSSSGLLKRWRERRSETVVQRRLEAPIRRRDIPSLSTEVLASRFSIL